MKNKQQKFRSGETVPQTADYKAYDANGRSHDEETTELKKGTKFPPLQHEGGYWERDDEQE